MKQPRCAHYGSLLHGARVEAEPKGEQKLVDNRLKARNQNRLKAG